MASKIEKLKATLSRSRKKARDSAARSTNMALTVASCYGSGYLTGRYTSKVTLGEAADGSGGINGLMLGGGLLAAGAAVEMVPEWAGAIGVGMLGGVLALDGAAAGVKASVSDTP